MPAKPGTRPPNAGKGRPKGVPNKATADVRKAIALIAERNIEAVERWLNEIDDPARRLELYLRMLEYHIPKLARTEVTGKDGADLTIVVQAAQHDVAL